MKESLMILLAKPVAEKNEFRRLRSLLLFLGYYIPLVSYYISLTILQ